jgi:hypothetical protein
MTKARGTIKARENWLPSLSFSSDLVKFLDKFSSSPCLKLLSRKEFIEKKQKSRLKKIINKKTLISTRKILN